ncbi:FtsX-like permease family protein [Marinobacter lacisalsi]|uniref:FtsX-like permease family protein n=1 Tax=Marinobacter lacisalsi TaxID=475979 RepID=A0ABV8QJI9_9GAMM
MILRAVLSHYRRHPLQLLALWLILALATALWSGVWTLTEQARDSMVAGDSQLSGRQQVVRDDGAPVTVADFASLRRAGLCVFPWLQVAAGEARGQVVGIDPLAMACAQGGAPGAGLSLDGQPFVDIAEAAEQAAAGYASTLRLYVSEGAAPLPEGWQRQADPGGLTTGELSDSFLLNLDALGLLVVLVSALLIRSVYTLALAQRRESLGLLERYGVTRRRLRLHLLLELMVLAGLGVVPGYLLGQKLADTLAGGFGAALDNLFETDLLATGESLAGFLVTLGMMILVVLWCGLDLLRGGSDSTRPKVHPVFGVVLVVAGILLIVPAQTLVTVFLGTALLLTGAGLITPALLAWSLSPTPDTPPLKLWRRRELGVLARRLALPLVALQLAAGTVIAVHALVSTFEGTFHGWLDQRLAGDLFVEIPEGEPLAPAAAWLEKQEGVTQWHPVVHGRARVPLPEGEQQVDLMATDTTSSLIRQWSLLAAVSRPWQALADGDVLVNEQLARRRELAPGSQLALVIAGKAMTVEIAGVYADYGRPAGEILLDIRYLPEGFVAGFRSLTIKLADSGASRSDVVSGLEAAWNVDSLQVRDNGTIHRLATRVFEQTFALTRSISYLTLMLAGTALLMTGWVVLRSRAWYVGLLSAWGLTRRQRRRTITILTAEFMLAIWVAALPVGVALTWVLVDRINPVAFGWTLPMAIYPGYWLELLLLFGLAAAVVGWLASIDRSRAPVQAPRLDGGQER